MSLPAGVLRETILNEAAFELQYLNQYDFI